MNDDQRISEYMRGLSRKRWSGTPEERREKARAALLKRLDGAVLTRNAGPANKHEGPLVVSTDESPGEFTERVSTPMGVDPTLVVPGRGPVPRGKLLDECLEVSAEMQAERPKRKKHKGPCHDCSCKDGERGAKCRYMACECHT